MVNVIENCIPVDIQDKIENLLFDKNFPWFFNEKTVYEDINKGYFFNDKNTVSGSQFNHTFLTDYKINSDFCKNIAPIMFYFSLASGIKVDKPIRIKANLTTPDIFYSENLHRPAHYDTLDKNIVTVIYYVNDSDGDTVFYDKRFEGDPVGDIKVVKSVTPKKGRAVIFDSNQLHAGSCPRESK